MYLFVTIMIYTKLQSYSMCCRQTYLLLQGLCVPSNKTTTYVCDRFKKKTGYIKFESKVLKHIKPNVGGLTKGLFLPHMLERNYKFDKHYLHLNLHNCLAS